MPSKNKGQTEEERAGWPTHDASCVPLIINVPATVRHMRSPHENGAARSNGKKLFSAWSLVENKLTGAETPFSSDQLGHFYTITWYFYQPIYHVSLDIYFLSLFSY